MMKEEAKFLACDDDDKYQRHNSITWSSRLSSAKPRLSTCLVLTG